MPDPMKVTVRLQHDNDQPMEVPADIPKRTAAARRPLGLSGADHAQDEMRGMGGIVKDSLRRLD